MYMLHPIFSLIFYHKHFFHIPPKLPTETELALKNLHEEVVYRGTGQTPGELVVGPQQEKSG